MSKSRTIASWMSVRWRRLARGPKVCVRRLLDRPDLTPIAATIEGRCTTLHLVLDPCVAPTLMLQAGTARLSASGWQQYGQHAMGEVLGAQAGQFTVRIERSAARTRLACAVPTALLKDIARLKLHHPGMRLSLQPLVAAGWALLPRRATLPATKAAVPGWRVFASDRSIQLIGMKDREIRLNPPMPRLRADPNEILTADCSALSEGGNGLVRLIEQTAASWGWTSTVSDLICVDFATAPSRALLPDDKGGNGRSLHARDTRSPDRGICLIRVADVVPADRAWFARRNPQQAFF